MIEVESVGITLSGRKILNNINATFQPGVPNLVIGASGSGKSVFLKCLVGLLTPQEGKIIYDDQDFLSLEYDQKQELRKQIGMLFQNNALFDSLTVEENVEFPLKMFSSMSKEERKHRVNECLSKVNLVNSNNKFPSEISGGMKKRVGIARAIALPIKYLFCDEPNSGLDPLTSRVIDDLILQITKDLNITTVINSHDMKTVKDIGENIIFIYQGTKWWQGNKADIVSARAANPELDSFFEASF
jgi:phospholipid/cholesterol/gamma-HCH transport system ATP-binding protein